MATDRGEGGHINLRIDDRHQQYLKAHPELNASAFFRSELDQRMDREGWEPDLTDDEAVDGGVEDSETEVSDGGESKAEEQTAAEGKA